MPTYEYRSLIDSSCDHCAEGFEIFQRVADEPLGHCPECDQPIRRVISAPAIARSDTSLSRENIEKHGFTQYRKSGKGVYEKTAGKGPDSIES